MDIGSGKGGDIKKWKRARLGEVYGIELDVKNIEYARNLFGKIPRPKPRVMYFIGDCSRLIFPDYDAGLTESDKINLRTYLPAQYTFDIIGIQFALHYFFKNEITFRTILQNITDNCKIGGYFIGTCFDGVRLFKALKGKKKISGEDEEGQLIWSIEKDYKTTRFNANKNSLGREIKVFVKSIGNFHTEYLVNFEYLDKMLIDYGFEKVRVTPFEEEYANMMNEDYSQNNNMMNIQNIDSKITDSEKEFGFLNNAFIYKKVKNAPEKERAYLLKLMKKQETKEAKKDNSIVINEGVQVVDTETEKLIENEETTEDKNEDLKALEENADVEIKPEDLKEEIKDEDSNEETSKDEEEDNSDDNEDEETSEDEEEDNSDDNGDEDESKEEKKNDSDEEIDLDDLSSDDDTDDDNTDDNTDDEDNDDSESDDNSNL